MSRTYEWATPDELALARSGLAGLDYLRAQARGECPLPPMALTVGWAIETVKPGFVRLRLAVAEFLLQGSGKLHGGAIATLLDSALAGSVISTLSASQSCVTTDLSARFVRGVDPKIGHVFAEAQAIHVGRNMAVAEAKVLDSQDTIYAIGTAGFAILARQARR